jgi:hypothetical protein
MAKRRKSKTTEPIKSSANEPKLVTPDLGPTSWRWLWLTLMILTPILVVLHYSDGVIKARNFINYDDLDLIKPMLKLSLSDYFQVWLPDRNNHAYPLRDMTYFLDQWLGQKIGIPFYWLTHILMLIACVGFCGWMLRTVVSGPVALLIGLSVAMALHPMNIEAVQWLMIRKHLMTMMVLWAGTGLVLLRFRERKALSITDWRWLWVCYIFSLLCFPTGLLWMPWVIWVQNRSGFLSPSKRPPLLIANVVIIGLYYAVTTTGEADYSNSLSGLLKGQTLVKGATFLFYSVGRGFWNLMAPFNLGTFYREDSPLIGWGYLALLGFSIWLYRKVQNPEDRRWFIILIGLTIATLGPSALVFVGFPDFVWADRYGFTVLPYFLMCLGLGLKTIDWQKPKVLGATVLISVIWLVFSVRTTVERVPLWRDAIPLMTECAKNEASAKCIIQTIQRTIHREGCGAMVNIIESGRARYAAKPKYNTEFKTEMPFYDALCVALSTKLPVDEKIEKIPYFWDIYEGSAEIMFSLVLANLEKGDLKAAWAGASSYYLKGDPLPLSVTRNTINIYRGHVKALCEILPQKECASRRDIYLTANEKTLDDPGYRNWGYNLTHTMFKRSQKTP